jgi:ankyrin repeat protein
MLSCLAPQRPQRSFDGKDKDVDLHVALRKGMVKEAESLLAKDDFKLNQKIVDYNGLHVLQWSVYLRALPVVKLLLNRHHVDPNVIPVDASLTPLMQACIQGDEDLDIVQFFLSRRDIQVNRREALLGRTALWYAALSGHPKVTKVLLAQQDIDPNLPDSEGRTPLFISIRETLREKNLSVFNQLLGKRGIDPNARDNRGSTPLVRACSLLNVDIVRLLLSHRDTDPNLVNNNGVSPLDIVSGTPSWDEKMQSAREDIKALLRAAGAR